MACAPAESPEWSSRNGRHAAVGDDAIVSQRAIRILGIRHLQRRSYRAAEISTIRNRHTVRAPLI